MDDRRRKRLEEEDSDIHRESIEIFMENMDEPDFGGNKVWFICNSILPEFKNIHAVVGIQNQQKHIDVEMGATNDVLSKTI